MPTKIVKCTCNNEFQDQKYGKNRRVANLTKRNPTGSVFRCTVCNREVGSGEGK